jgi:hypothetical protein
VRKGFLSSGLRDREERLDYGLFFHFDEGENAKRQSWTKPSSGTLLSGKRKTFSLFK